MSVRNDRLRAEMDVTPSLQKVIVVHHIIQVVANIICGAVSIHYLLFYILLMAIIPILLFIIFCIASKCNSQDLAVILVHFNPILSTLWFITVFPVFFLSCYLNRNLAMDMYYYSNTIDIRVTVVAVITGFLSLSSATSAAWGIWKSARNVVLGARSRERDPVDGVGCVPPPYEAPVTFTDLNRIRIPQVPYGQPMMTQ